MSGRPRRSAAQKANEAITDMAEHSEKPSGMSSRSRTTRTSGASISREPASSSPGNSSQHLNLNIKVPASRLRQATTGRNVSVTAREGFVGGEILDGKRNRGGKKSYVVESESDEEEEVEEEEDDDVEEDDDEMEDAEGEEEDAEGEEDGEMDVDAEGEDEDAEGEEEDADGDVDMDVPPAPTPTIKISRSGKPVAPPSAPARSKPSAARLATTVVSTPEVADDDDDEEELSEIEMSDEEDEQGVGGDEDAEGEEEDAEGEEEEEEEVEVGDGDGELDAEGEEEEVEVEDAGDLDSDDESGSRAGTPDLSKMTKRQRARFEDEPQEYMKLSDEVQVKKHFTAEELSMRRAEMARRRRNLSEKRNEEVKMETINKLLKKQAPKQKGRVQGAGDETPNEEAQKPSPLFVRWVSSKDGIRVGVPEEILEAPVGRTFVPGGLRSGRMVEEVS